VYLFLRDLFIIIKQVYLFAGNPLLATMDSLRMIEAPSGISGRAFYVDIETVNEKDVIDHQVSLN
jgi:hypothetical protein